MEERLGPRDGGELFRVTCSVDQVGRIEHNSDHVDWATFEGRWNGATHRVEAVETVAWGASPDLLSTEAKQWLAEGHRWAAARQLVSVPGSPFDDDLALLWGAVVGAAIAERDRGRPLHGAARAHAHLWSRRADWEDPQRRAPLANDLAFLAADGVATDAAALLLEKVVAATPARGRLAEPGRRAVGAGPGERQ